MLVASDPLGQESLRLAIVPIAISDGRFCVPSLPSCDFFFNVLPLLQNRLVVTVGKSLLSWFLNRNHHGGPFCPGSSNRDKRRPLVPVGSASADVAGTPLVSVGVTNWDHMALFFSCFFWIISIPFQIQFYIEI